MSEKRVGVILGAMTFGTKAVDKQLSYDLTTQFLKNYREIDTAYMYNDGQSEEILGDYFKEKPAALSSIFLATKVNPLPDSGKSLTRDSIRHQFTTSLQRLKLPSVDLLYLHLPDHNTPIEESLETVNEFHKEGKFKELGISNYSAKEVEEICAICDAKGFIRPTVYQGMYNLFTRSIEELFPVLRKEKIRFYAYNPLAGGLLSGRYKDISELNTLTEGRFVERKIYQDRYWKPSFFEAVKAVNQGIETAKATGGKERSTVEVALKWLVYHSKLDGKFGDAVIIGASKPNHLEDNLKVWDEEYGPNTLLEKDILDACDLAWEKAKGDCPNYFR